MWEKVGSVLQLSRGEHAADLEWRLTRSEAEQLGREECLQSPTVSFAGSGWELDLGWRDSDSEELDFFLRRFEESSPAPVVRYWVGARTGDDEEEIGRGTAEGDEWESDYHPWLRPSELWSRMERPAPSPGTFFSIFVRLRTGPETDGEMERLFASGKPTQTDLTVAQTSCPDAEVGGATNSATTEEPPRIDLEDALILRNQFKELLLHGDDHDVLLRVKDKEFRAHKSVLRARSPVFRAMFRHDMRENAEDSVTIEDVDPECFGDFLAFIYTGEVENLTAINATGLYYAADKYAFPSLKRKCVDMLKASLATSLVCDVITLAMTHGEEELMEVALAYFTEHQAEVMETVEWQRFTLSNPIRASEVCLAAARRYRASHNQN